MHTFWKEFLHNPTPTLTNPSTMVTLSSGFTLVRMTDTFLSRQILDMCSRFHLLWSTPGSGWCNYPYSRLHLQFSLFETFCNNIQFPKSLLSIQCMCVCKCMHFLIFIFIYTPWRRAQQPTSVFLPGEPHGQRSLAGYSTWGLKELDITEVTQHTCMCTYTHIHTYIQALISCQAQHQNVDEMHYINHKNDSRHKINTFFRKKSKQYLGTALSKFSKCLLSNWQRIKYCHGT